MTAKPPSTSRLSCASVSSVCAKYRLNSCNRISHPTLNTSATRAVIGSGDGRHVDVPRGGPDVRDQHRTGGLEHRIGRPPLAELVLQFDELAEVRLLPLPAQSFALLEDG